MYFGLSFSRVGYDFRQQLAPIFTNAVERQFSQAIQKSSAPTQLSASLGRSQLSRLTTLPPPQSGSAVQDPSQPPLQLVDYPPLAEICNIVLAALNEISLCAPLSVTSFVTGKIQKLLEDSATQMSDFQATANPGWAEKETAGFEQLVSAMSVLLPYLQKCLSVVFPPAELTNVLGFPTSHLRSRAIGHLNTERIMKPLQQFLVSTVDTAVLSAESEVSCATVYVADRIEQLAEAAVDVTEAEDGKEGIDAGNEIDEENISRGTADQTSENNVQAELVIKVEKMYEKSKEDNVVSENNVEVDHTFENIIEATLTSERDVDVDQISGENKVTETTSEMNVGADLIFDETQNVVEKFDTAESVTAILPVESDTATSTAESDTADTANLPAELDTGTMVHSLQSQTL